MSKLAPGSTAIVTFFFLALTSEAFAQANSGVSGTVRDASGGVLPGVAVEAASPALIEKVRIAVTDGQGRYSLVNLPIGTYAVTFTLPGFSTAIREGIELAANFTATVNVVLQVGALEETLTVAAESPVVDVQSTASRNLIRRDTLDTVPTGRTVSAYIALTPGLIAPPGGMDVGGSKGESHFATGVSIHGSKEMLTMQDGFVTNIGATGRIFVPNPGSTAEVSMELGGGTAEYETGGVQVNFIPRDGSNVFRGDLFSNFTNQALQGTNVSAEVTRRGLDASSINRVKNIYEVTGSIGGPIARDRLWFLASQRYWGGATYVAGMFYNQTPESFKYTPDRSRPAFSDYLNLHTTTRLTWQASQKNKITFAYDWQYRCDCHKGIDGSSSSPIPTGGTYSPEAVHDRIYRPNDVITGSWSYPATNRLLFEGAVSGQILSFTSNQQEGVLPDTIPVYDQTLNLYYRAPFGRGVSNTRTLFSRFSTSYVTGSHVFKTGVQFGREGADSLQIRNGNLTYTFQNGRPVQLTQWATPYTSSSLMKANLGVYVQDRWTTGRLTLTPGLRMDYLNGGYPAQEVEATRFTAARSYPQVDCQPCWIDLSPRLSVAYDVFGNGKTALKFGLNRYVRYTVTAGASPVGSRVNSTNRTWTDDDGDFVADCDLTNRDANGECRAVSNRNFGTDVVSTRYADDVLEGFNIRPANWQVSAGVQHELIDRVAITANYFRTSWINFTVTDNRTVTAADYDEYCITLPTDPRVPGAGGRMCGLYNLNPSKFGQPADNLVTRASHYGEMSDVYHGVDITVSGRFRGGASINGGLSTGRTATDNCVVIDSPQGLVFCNQTPPFQTQLKFAGSYPLPWNLQLSGVFQNLAGTPITASYVATNAEVAPSLGRPLSGGATTVVVPAIIEPDSIFEGRINQLDLRLTRTFELRGMRIEPMADVYNVFNASPILTQQTRFGPVWRTPTSILEARLFKFGMKVEF